MTSPTVEVSSTEETPSFTELTDSDFAALQEYKDKLVEQATQSLAEANALLGTPLNEIKELPLVVEDGIPMPPELPKHSLGFLPLSQFSEYAQRYTAYWEENKRLIKAIYDTNDKLYKQRSYSPNQRPDDEYHFGIYRTCEDNFNDSLPFAIKMIKPDAQSLMEYVNELEESCNQLKVVGSIADFSPKELLEFIDLGAKVERSKEFLEGRVKHKLAQLLHWLPSLEVASSNLKKCAKWAVEHQQENKQWHQELNPVEQTNTMPHSPPNNEGSPAKGNQARHHQSSAFEKCRQSEVFCDWLVKQIKYLELEMARLNKRLKLYSSSLFSCSRCRRTTDALQPTTTEDAIPLIPLHPKKIT